MDRGRDIARDGMVGSTRSRTRRGQVASGQWPRCPATFRDAPDLIGNAVNTRATRTGRAPKSPACVRRISVAGKRYSVVNGASPSAVPVPGLPTTRKHGWPPLPPGAQKPSPSSWVELILTVY
jgi:hypothetical protein